jgi:hypothetical protein
MIVNAPPFSSHKATNEARNLCEAASVREGRRYAPGINVLKPRQPVSPMIPSERRRKIFATLWRGHCHASVNFAQERKAVRELTLNRKCGRRKSLGALVASEDGA